MIVTFNDIYLHYSLNRNDYNSLFYFLFVMAFIYLYKLGLYSRKIFKEEIKYNSYDEEKKKFLKLFEKDSTFVNSNINPDIYIYEKYQNMLNDQSNIDEKLWKSRVLIDYNEKTNIIMFYDIFKHSFSYFADFNLNYNNLNQTAMKYVRTFFCRDFFIDNTITPENFNSPFIKNIEDILKKENQDKEAKKKKLNIQLDSDVFLKKKPENKKIENKKNDDKDDKISTIYRNNFCYCGKILNFSPIIKTNFKDKKKISYKDFKMNKL